MANELINKIETSIYNNINHQSRYVSNKNSLFENLFNKLSKKFFETQDEFELFVNNYISSLSYDATLGILNEINDIINLFALWQILTYLINTFFHESFRIKKAICIVDIVYCFLAIPSTS